ncbi:MAG: UvrD-helicase domain-containing protein [Bacilli bacterium]|nr:UvrD-helicase domain-containing protein [Bacilli bacterium]
MNFEKELNERQLEAVTTSYPHVRIIAGAGSGKTRVLTYRIAFLISEMHVAPWKILAITFTNKVANEMRKRVVDMLPEVEKDLTIKTFHSFAALFLRREIHVLDYPASFTILDEEDQKKLIQDIAVERGFRRGDKIVGKTMSYIGSCKLKEKYPDDITIIKPSFEDERECLEIYKRYEEEKDKMLSLDFDDLLLKTNYILENYPQVRMRWQDRIDDILIDEFQDTNDIEYKLVKFLKRPDAALYVVGDPDQTIYTWRGANQNIILELEKQFLDMETIILDRNYRSTSKILTSANKLISNNKMRVKKDLYTKNNPGDDVVVHSSSSSQSEAEYVAREVQKLKQVNGYAYKDIAILYRSSYVTMDFEHAFVAKNIPYRIYGGQKFYQRKEIKDVLAYFHLIVNVKDNISFLRIINTPRRGIGDTTVNLLKEESDNNNQSLYEYVRDVDVVDSNVSKKALNSLKTMITLIEKARADIDKKEEVFSKILEDMIYSLGYQDYLLKDDDDGEDRLENVKALFQDLRHYLKSNPDSSFEEYLQNIALVSAQDELVDGDFVTFMTVHTAKGLEYPVIFVVRFNNGVFPHVRSVMESGYKGIEEERRLAYVAMTRAKERLYLTLAGDYSYVLGGALTPSQFIIESGNKVITNNDYSPYRNTNTRPKQFHFDDGPNLDFTKDEPIRQNFSQATNDIDEWQVGDIVIHKTLGKGVVIELEGDGIIKVNFENHGNKSIMGNHPFVSKGGHAA